jgi:hypothetical protein
VLSTGAFLWAPCLVFWRHHTDPWLRAALALFVPYVMAMVVIGHIVEIRIFAEFTPTLFCATVLLAYNTLRRGSTHDGFVVDGSR